MRFLLKPAARSAAAKSSQNIIASASATKAVASSQHAPTASATRIPTSSSKGWGQQCSPNCGCVLRIETQLSETPLSISPTIVQASYHAKRVMATTNNTTTNDIHQLKPLLVPTSQHSNSSTGAPSRPILTSCTCPTLHTLAKRTIEHLPGKTLAQIRNEIGNNMGGSSSAGLRSSVALRHTVLREQMIQIDPTTVSVSSRMGTKKNKNKLGIAIASSVDSIQHQQLGKRHITDTQIKNGDIHSASASGAQEMNLTDRHGHCYDLFEDSLLSMIYERMPSPRKEDHSETYSPTLGGPFRMYSIYERNKPPTPEKMNDEIKQEQQQQELKHYHDLLSSYEGRSWQTKSPSSFFLFGDGYYSSPTNGTSSRSSSTLNMTSMLFQNMMESIHTGIFGEEKRRNNAATATTDAAAADRDDDYAASTSYLELLDMYGDEHNGDEDHQQALDDWLEYVDQMHYSDGVNRSRSTG